MKLPKNLEKAGIQEAGGCLPVLCSWRCKNQKGKNGLLNDYSSPETCVGYLHCAHPVSLTPNSETPKLHDLCGLGLGSWIGAGVPQGPGVFLLKFIHKIVDITVDLGLDSQYIKDRIRMVLHIASFRGDGQSYLPR